MYKSLCFYLATILVVAFHQGSAQQPGKFPDDFVWGVGTSSYQIEGGWNADGKTPSIWDHLTQNEPHRILDCSNGNVAADSYNLYKRDVQMVKELGVQYYRFSISWNRVLPQGYSYEINEKGIQYYSNLVDELIANGIKPMVTMFHWDLPQRLQELGGWTNPEIVDLFVEYARVLITRLGDRVKFWSTFNEPLQTCLASYNFDQMAPGINFPGIPNYLCTHNVLKAHAEVYHLYKDLGETGQMGIVCDSAWHEPLTSSAADKAASDQALQFSYGWYMHAILSESGNYPPIMIERIDRLSTEQGFAKSRLPKFTPAEIARIKGTADYMALNHYSSTLVKPNDASNSAGMRIPSFEHDQGKIDSVDPAWPTAASTWLKIVPFGIYKLLMWLHQEYNGFPIYITENGVSDLGGTNDTVRVDYYNHYLDNVLKAINEGANVKGYIAWSLLDNFEWRAGYTERFGMYHVDFNSADKKRVAKMSARVYKKIVATNQIDFDYKPEPEVFIETPTDWDSSLCQSSGSAIKFSFVLIVSSILLKLFC